MWVNVPKLAVLTFYIFRLRGLEFLNNLTWSVESHVAMTHLIKGTNTKDFKIIKCQDTSTYYFVTLAILGNCLFASVPIMCKKFL